MAFLLRTFALHPRRRLGQHFLADPRLCRRIADSCGVAPGERVVEVGPGLGALTLALLEAGAEVLAVERDPGLARALKGIVAQWGPSALRDGRIRIVAADVLALDLGRLLAGPPGPSEPGPTTRRGVVASNLPYGITSPFLLQLVRAGGWRRAVLMVQKEVGQRLAARPGDAAYGSLTVAVQARCRVAQVLEVSRRCFVPPPEVDSVVVALEPLGAPLAPDLDEALERVLRAGFGQRRKMLRNAMARLYVRADEGPPSRDDPGSRACKLLAEAGIDPQRRAETLSPGEFLRLAQLLRRGGP